MSPVTLIQDSSHPDGVYDDSGHNSGRQVVRARDRKAAAAIEMSVEGYTWSEVAEVLGYPTARHALLATERWLEQNLQDRESRDHLRRMASDRLQRLTRSVWGKATDPEHPEHLMAVGKARDLLTDFVKLHGAAAPTEVTVHSPSEAEIDALVGKVVATQVPQLEEDDIFSDDGEETDVVDADLVEEEESDGVA